MGMIWGEFVTLLDGFNLWQVSHSIVARRPDAYDSQYNQIVREQTQRKSLKEKKLLRLRSVSPPKLRSGHQSSGKVLL